MYCITYQYYFSHWSKQFIMLYKHALKVKIGDVWSYDKAVVSIGLGLITGIIFWQIGTETSRRAIGEVVGLLFYAMTVWIFNPLYPAIINSQLELIGIDKDVSSGKILYLTKNEYSYTFNSYFIFSLY